jgi:cellulose synthase/poly-beta-1,6-N-acetylglucosamine synthase-like glycosyltransferase
MATRLRAQVEPDATTTISLPDSVTSPPRLERTAPASPGRLWLAAWLADLEPSTRRAVRRVVVLSCLLPLLAILARSVPYLGESKLLLAYGMAVLGSTIGLMYVAFTRYEDPSIGATLPVPSPRVSCIVAVKDEVEDIRRCVQSMLDSDYPDLEVIVVEDASTDGTAELLAEMARVHPFKLLTMETNVGKKRALAFGVEHAIGELLVFTDSDCVLAPDAISRCVAPLVTNPDLGAVSGHSRALNANTNLLTRIQDVWYDGQFRIAKAAESTFQSVTCISGPLAAFRREAIFNYLPAWVEDTFLGQPFRFSTDRQLTGYVLGQQWVGRRLKRQFADSPFVASVNYPERRWRVEYVRSAKVWTNVPATYRTFLRQQVRWKKSFIRNFFFTGRFIWRRGFGPAVLYYSHALWVVMAPLMAIRHLVWLPLHGFWLLTGLYVAGVALKGWVWAFAYKIENPGCRRWVYRPLMSVVSSLLLSWLLFYSASTIRRNVWSRGTT